MCIYSWGGRYHPSNRTLFKLLNSISFSLTDRKQFCHNESHVCICGFTQTLTATLPSVYLELFNHWWFRWKVKHKKLSNHSSDDQPPTTERLFSFVWTFKNHRDWSIWRLPRSSLSAGTHFSLNQSETQRKVRKLNPNANRLQEVAHIVPLNPLTYFNLFLKPWYCFVVFCQPSSVLPAPHYPSSFRSIINKIKII